MRTSQNVYPTLKQALNDEFLSRDLKIIADIMGVNVPSTKAERIEVIVSTLFNDLPGYFSQLSTSGQNAVAETIHNWDNFFHWRPFINKYFSSPMTESENNSKRQIILLDLFIVERRVPVDLLERLKEFVPKPQEINTDYEEDVESEGLVVRETATPALANLATFLTMARDKKIRVSAKTGKATAATMRKMGELLYEPDWYDDDTIGPMQVFAWPLLLQGGGLAKADGSLLKLTPTGRKALQDDQAGGIKKAWQRWEKSTLFDEFSRVTAIKGQKSNRGRTMTTPVKRRPMINRLLKDLQPGKWISLEELDRQMQANLYYNFPMVNYEWKLYFDEPHYGHIDHHFDTWPLLQFRYLLIYLFEYCATLGLVDVAYTDPYWARSEDYRSYWGTDELEYLSHCDGLKYVRINKLGAFVFGHIDEYEEEKEDALFVLDGADLIFTGRRAIAPGKAIYLEKVAERVEVDRWRFSVSSLLTAVESGENLLEIRKMLESLCSEKFSNEMELLFKEAWEKTSAFIDVGQASLIECGREFRKQVLSNNKLSKLCLPAGEKYLVVLPGQEMKFASAIKAMGFILGVKK